MWLAGIIYGFCALIMLIIGIDQYRSKTPVHFYTGETPPKPEEITDVKAWNHRHGMMWMIYGFLIMLSWFFGYLLRDTLLCVIPLIAGICAPIFGMIWYHEYLVKRYKK